MSHLKIGFIGGVPAGLGGGGLERQIECTAAALERLGHEIVWVERDPSAREWDVLHAFGAEGNVQFLVAHWTRGNAAPLVISPVVVVSPGWQEWALRTSSALPAPITNARMRALTLRRADLLVALTRYEQGILRRLTNEKIPVEVVPNGVSDEFMQEQTDGSAGSSGHVLLLGEVSARKRQAEIVSAIGERERVVVAGGFRGTEAERMQFESALERSGAEWLGRIDNAQEVARLQRQASALVHYSHAEGQSLAVLETLAQGTPVVLSDIPSHRELAEQYPVHVRIVKNLTEIAPAVAALRKSPPDPSDSSVPTWDAVAMQLETLYRQLVKA